MDGRNPGLVHFCDSQAPHRLERLLRAVPAAPGLAHSACSYTKRSGDPCPLPRIRKKPTSRGAIAARPRYQPVEGPHDPLSVAPFGRDRPHPVPEHEPKKEVSGDGPPDTLPGPV